MSDRRRGIARLHRPARGLRTGAYDRDDDHVATNHHDGHARAGDNRNHDADAGRDDHRAECERASNADRGSIAVGLDTVRSEASK
jgi:hypothetical protein